MANFSYKWSLSGSFVSREAFPVFGNALSVEWAKDNEQKFFRLKVSGKIKFVGKDYADIMADPFSQKFTIDLTMLQGGSLYSIFSGYFYKSDCEIDKDSQIIEVSPSIDDGYQKILDGLDKEFNLVKLAPAIEPISIMKRPIIQVYNPGDTEITCILSGMYWTQPCESVNNTSTLTSNYKFSHLSGWYKNVYSIIPPAGGWAPTDPQNMPNCFVATNHLDSAVRNGYFVEVTNYGETGTIWITREADNQRLWHCNFTVPLESPAELTMTSSYGYTSFKLVRRYVTLYARIVCDSDSILGVNTNNLPTPDITENTMNYHKVVGYNMSGVAYLYDEMSETPTELGQWDDGLYWKPYTPPVIVGARYFPICRNIWDSFSLWWSGSSYDWMIEEDGRSPYVFRDAYPLWSVLSVLLSEIGAGVSFAKNANYSRFLYGDGGGVRGANYELYISPKSNLITTDYEQAAQRGTITLRNVLDMLRDCFQCYWFIEVGKFRIEHIEYFRKGGDYFSTPLVGIDLTDLYYSRSGKTIATGQNKYKYNKPETYGRIQWAWMDDVTQQFDGNPIDIISNYINKQSTKDITLSQFTSDVDYIVSNPGEVSKDGFVLFGAIDDGNGNKLLPFVSFGDNNEYKLQNGYMSFLWLYRYYLYNLPAPDYEIAGTAGTALGIQRLIEQDVSFPAEYRPNLLKLVKTGLGDGMIETLSFEVLSKQCKAKLSYEQF